MRFVARAPREGINVSDEHPLKEAAILTVGIATVLAGIAFLLVAFVDIVVFFVSPETEARIFADWDFAARLDPSAESEAAPELVALTRRLARHWPDAPYAFELSVIDDDGANAIALPGGTILVTRGLLDQVESENELAFVLGHELGHFRNRDHLRSLGRVVALGLVLMAVSGSDGGLVSGSVVDLTSRRFGRDQEAAADAFALELLFAEYGHVADATRFFERQDRGTIDFGRFAGYFSTHPAADDRIERLDALARARGWPTTGETRPR